MNINIENSAYYIRISFFIILFLFVEYFVHNNLASFNNSYNLNLDLNTLRISF